MKRLTAACLILISATMSAQVLRPAQHDDIFAGTFKTISSAAPIGAPEILSRSSKSTWIITEYAWVGDWFVGEANASHGDEAASDIWSLWSFRAKFDGKEYPFQTDPSKTITLQKLNKLAWLRVDKQDGKLIASYTQILSDDGKTLTTILTQVRDDGTERTLTTRAERQ